MTEMSLTRDQVQQLATFFALDSGIHSVTIRETYQSGIGASYSGMFHKNQVERDFEADITDVSNW